jgi:NTE family protein
MIRNFSRPKFKPEPAVYVPLRNSCSMRLIAAMAAVVSFVFVASAQNTSQNTPHVAHRPRIGLVLEGGGALGLAHIGVIQWLEEHHIPVRYVSGTSMGALNG